MILDPRLGDAEDDISSPKARSLAALGVRMFAEISPIKLLFAFAILVVAPALTLGLAPIVVGAWFATVSRVVQTVTGLGSLVAIGGSLLLLRYARLPLFRILENNFWSLNSILVQPGYVLFREILRQAVDQRMPDRDAAGERDYVRRRNYVMSLGAALLLCAVCAMVAVAVWGATRWTGAPADLLRPSRLLLPALANAVVLVAVYAAFAALLAGLADAAMDPARDIAAFDLPRADVRVWRVAHLSDVHVVGEQFGFRIESGRDGARGNRRFEATLERLAALHAVEPIDMILVTGDVTDAGRSTEWAEFLELIKLYPALAGLLAVAPGNHDVNIIDRANPARFELPFGAGKRLRKIRVLSALDAIQGDRVLVVGAGPSPTMTTLREKLAPHRARLAKAAVTGARKGSMEFDRLWADCFPQILPPSEKDGLGVLLLDTNAETHFSFTNALGLLTGRQATAMEAVFRRWPHACWIVALHHHVVEYPGETIPLSMRIGTALINGSWMVRQLKRHGHRLVVMHGHRHFDWIGHCGPVRIVSAPSSVMNGSKIEDGYFLLHRLQSAERRLGVLTPERISLVNASAAPMAHEV